MHQKTKDYYTGLMHCIRNDIENGYFYLNRAAEKGKKAAIEILKELEEKHLITPSLRGCEALSRGNPKKGV